MNPSDLTPTQIAVIALVVVAIVALLVWMLQRRRTARLRARFGEEEYNRALAEGGERRMAEAHLEQRAKRVESFHLRALSTADRARFTEEWAAVQARFVDAPAGAVTEADQLVGDLMATRGYPVANFEQRAADISVDHPEVTQNYRAAHAIALRHAAGQATTEDLRRAMIHYRSLFDELLGKPQVMNQPAAPTARAEYPTAEPTYRAR